MGAPEPQPEVALPGAREPEPRPDDGLGGQSDLDEGPEPSADVEPSLASLRADILEKVERTPGDDGPRRSMSPERPRRPTPVGSSTKPRCVSLVDASLDFWLTSGRFCRELEKGLAEFVGVAECRLVNSGSSANLLAFSTLTSPRLGDRRIRPGR